MYAALRLLSNMMHKTMIKYRPGLAWTRSLSSVTRSRRSLVGNPSVVDRASFTPRNHVGCWWSDVSFSGSRRRHLAAVVHSTSPAAAAAAAPEEEEENEEQQPAVVTERIQVDTATETPTVVENQGDNGTAGLSRWQAFLQELWQRGCFEAHSAGQNMAAATSARRDVKKALQHLGRARPDIALLLPQQLLTDLASQQYPERMEKKNLTALQRLKASVAQQSASGSTAAAAAAAAAAGGGASTQDVLRVLWGLAETLETTTATAAAAETGSSTSPAPTDVLASCLTQILDLQQQTPDPALIAAAEAAAATPNAASYEQHQAARKDAAAAAVQKRWEGPSNSSRPRGDASSPKQKASGDRQRDSSSSSSSRQQEPTVKFPHSNDPVVQHKLRLLSSGPYKELRAGDWFCGECGAHNYGFKELCFRCEVPSNSLGASKVTVNDVRQLQQIGLSRAFAYEQRRPALAFALQVAQAVTAELSLPAAAQAAGVHKFVPIDLPELSGPGQRARGGDRSTSSSSSSSYREGRDRDVRGRSNYSQAPDGSGDLRESRSRGVGGRGTRDLTGRRLNSGPRGAAAAAEDEAGPRAAADGQWGRPAAAEGASQPGGRRSSVTSSVTGSAASSSGSLTDALKEAFSGLEAEFGLGRPAVPARQLQQPQQQQQQQHSSTEDMGTSRVRRVKRQQPAAEPFAVSADADGASAGRSSGSRRLLFAEGAQQRRRGAGVGYDDDDDDDLSGWAADYKSVAGSRSSEGRGGRQRDTGDDEFADGQERSWRGGARDSRGESEEDDGGWYKREGWTTSRGGRSSSGGRGGRGPSSPGGRGGRSSTRRDGASRGKGSGTPSWASIFD